MAKEAQKDFGKLQEQVCAYVMLDIEKEEKKRLNEKVFMDYRQKHFELAEEEKARKKESTKQDREYSVIASYLDSIADGPITDQPRFFDENWCNTSSLENCIQSLKTLETQEIIRSVETIKIAIMKGYILKQLHGRAYTRMLKSVGLEYSQSYISFLKNLYSLYLEQRLIASSRESLYFWRRNLSILKRFFKGEISSEVIELLLLGRCGKKNFRDLSESQKQQMTGLGFPTCYFTEPTRDISTDLIPFSSMVVE